MFTCYNRMIIFETVSQQIDSLSIQINAFFIKISYRADHEYDDKPGKFVDFKTISQQIDSN